MIDWKNIKNFKPSEFSKNELDFLDPEVLYRLQQYRNHIRLPIHPSPIKGAIARFDGNPNSQHYAVNRLSTAIDIFPEGLPFKNWLVALNNNLFMGVGFYLDTYYDGVPWVMFHLDIRKYGYQGRTLSWYRNEFGEYYYPQKSDNEFALLYRQLCKNNIMIIPRHKKRNYK